MEVSTVKGRDLLTRFLFHLSKSPTMLSTTDKIGIVIALLSVIINVWSMLRSRY